MKTSSHRSRDESDEASAMPQTLSMSGAATQQARVCVDGGLRVPATGLWRRSIRTGTTFPAPGSTYFAYKPSKGHPLGLALRWLNGGRTRYVQNNICVRATSLNRVGDHARFSVRVQATWTFMPVVLRYVCRSTTTDATPGPARKQGEIDDVLRPPAKLVSTRNVFVEHLPSSGVTARIARLIVGWYTP